MLHSAPPAHTLTHHVPPYWVAPQTAPDVRFLACKSTVRVNPPPPPLSRAVIKSAAADPSTETQVSDSLARSLPPGRQRPREPQRPAQGPELGAQQRVRVAPGPHKRRLGVLVAVAHGAAAATAAGWESKGPQVSHLGAATLVPRVVEGNANHAFSRGAPFHADPVITQGCQRVRVRLGSRSGI